MLAAIDDAKASGYELVVFTGGEPTLVKNDLIDVLRHATGLGMLTRVVTNAHWAKDLERARSRVRGLVEAGLKEIILVREISTHDLCLWSV
jgi:MoaA/NifB/PqqE/SkfB family radical SAM enzyme